jgi:hypothetical protein
MSHRLLGLFSGFIVAVSFGCSDDSTEPDPDPSTTASSSTTGAGPTTTSASTSSAGGSGGEGGSGGSTGDGGAGGSGGAGGGAGCDAFTVNVGDLRAESVKRLSDFFNQAGSFEGGTLWFNEGMSAYDGCPGYAPFDHTSVVYVADIDPMLVPPELGPRKVGVTWGLNGEADIWFVPPEASPANFFFHGRSPISGVILLQNALSDTQKADYFAALQAAHPGAPLTFLSGVGMITYVFDDGQIDGNEAPGLHDEVIALLDDARDDAQVSLIEPDGYFFPVPFDFPNPVVIDLEDSHDLAPECLRDLTLPFAGQFESAPSFPPPFGTGWMDELTPCQ